MTCRVIIARDPLDLGKWEVHEDVSNVGGLLATEFLTWPPTGRIYHGSVSQATDITPFDEEGVERLLDIEGDVYVVVYPEGPAVLLIGLVVAVAAVVAIAVLLKPQIPEVSTDSRNLQNSSPNNELGERTNRPRINARIPDIFGTVRSTPDLISQVYKIYENNQEVEISYMCVGRGEYTIHDVKDGDTRLSYIPGSAAAFYNPGQTPNGGTPFYSVGAPILEPLRRAKRVEQVVGQELRAPNSASANSPGNFKFQYPDRIYNSAGYNFSDKFIAGDQVSVTGATFTGPSATVTTNQIARYFHNTGNEYVEWQGDDPRNYFVVGDSLIISNSTTTLTKKPVTVSWSGYARFNSDGRIYFDQVGQDHPQELGNDFHINKTFTLSSATLNYNFSGTYTITSKTANTLTFNNPTAVTDDWNYVNGTSWGYRSFTVRGITSNYRIEQGGVLRAETSNFNDLNVGDTVVLTDATYSTQLSGDYQATSFSDPQDYWALSNPSGVTAEWNEIKSGFTRYVPVTIEQTHSTDTGSVNFNGTYTITGIDANRIFVSGANWSFLTTYLNNRSEYSGTDTFSVTAPVRSINLDGTYTIVSVGLYEIILSNPSAVQVDWGKLQFYPADEVIPTNATVATTGGNWIGPFFLDDPDMTHVYSNFIADQGLFKDDGKDQTRVQIEVSLLFYPANELGVAVGAAQTANLTMTGSAVNRETVAATRQVGLTVPGRQLMYCRRVTPKDTTFEGSVVDEVKWKEVWMIAPETRTDFGNVTTVQTKTYATGGALAIKERKLNCLVTRKIPYITGFTGDVPFKQPVYHPDLIATNDAAQIFCAIAKDPQLGGRTDSEIDFYGIFQARSAVQAYFGGQTKATEFAYTFDNNNISFEEMAQAIANASFCVAYRQGEKIKWKPEIATSDSTLIFNHRNKIPDTETRTVRFGSQDDYDSIQMEWINPEDDSVETFFIPEDQSGVKTKKIDTIGIRNVTQATWHAWRSYYKTMFQNVAVEFEATQEASLLVTRDRVLNADNTRAETQDGEVWDQEVLQLSLSQEVNFKPGVSYTIFLQHIDGTTEAIPCTAVSDNLNVLKNVYFRPGGVIEFQNLEDAGILSRGNTVAITGATITDATNGALNLNGTFVVEDTNAADGFVTLVNPGAINADWNDVSVRSALKLNVRFISERYAKRLVNLQYAPRAPLSLDPANYARATYIIRGNDEVAPQAFMVQETRPRDNFTYQVSLVNYDPRFYYMDDLQFWMNFDDGTFKDASAMAHDADEGTAGGKAVISYDSVRNSPTFHNVAGGSAARVTSADLYGGNSSYTKAVWVKQSGGFDCYFLSSNNEQFRCNNSNRLIAGHGANLLTYVGFPSSDGLWHHIACTYDKDTLILRLYLDGVLKAQKTNVAVPTVGLLQPIGINGNVGVIAPRCDDVRYWRRAFTSEEVMDLYNATR